MILINKRSKERPKGCCDTQPRAQGGGHFAIELWEQKGKVGKGKLKPGKYQKTFRKLY